MIVKDIIATLLLVVFVHPIFAQKKIILEKIRCQSFNTPLKNYLQNEEIKKTIATQLNHTLFQHQLIPLADTVNLNIEFLPFTNEIRAVKPDFSDPDMSNLHLYIDFFEASPTAFFSNPDNYISDSNLIKRAATLFMIRAWILKSDKTIVWNEMLTVMISSSETPGMGILYGDGIGIRYGVLAVTPKGLTELLKTTTNQLFDPKNDLEMIEMKVKPAFLVDNYILPKTISQPRTYISTTKNISTYTYQKKTEMLRMSDAVYEEIKIKGKNAEKYPGDLTNAIKTTDHFSSSDYIFLRQDCRDVIRDKNYMVKLTVQIDPNNRPSRREFLFTNFLKGRFHYLLQEKDTLAKFSIQKDVPDKMNKIYPDMISNGYDSISIFRMNTNFLPAWQLTYNYIINGFISNSSFDIKCSGARNTIKEIYFEDKLVCIAQGKFSPEKFVVFDASLSPELLNQLLMIGFNTFFE